MPNKMNKMITLSTDFNMRESDGRYPVLLPDDVEVVIGETVLVTDGEGRCVEAVVDEVSSDGRYAMVKEP